MSQDEIKNKISQIKLDLRACMNGVASASMRQTEDYRVNFGVELARLECLSADVADDLSVQDKHDLAQALWKEAVRECRIMATMIQPSETFDEEFCDVWMESIHTAEIGQIACLYLFQKLPFISDKALEWIAEESELKQICGFTVFVHLSRKSELNERTLQELADQAEAAMASENVFLKKIASRWTNDSNTKKKS